MVAEFQSQYWSDEDSEGDTRIRATGRHTFEREEISIWNPFSKRRNIVKW